MLIKFINKLEARFKNFQKSLIYHLFRRLQIKFFHDNDKKSDFMKSCNENLRHDDSLFIEKLVFFVCL